MATVVLFVVLPVVLLVLPIVLPLLVQKVHYSDHQAVGELYLIEASVQVGTQGFLDLGVRVLFLLTRLGNQLTLQWAKVPASTMEEFPLSPCEDISLAPAKYLILLAKSTAAHVTCASSGAV